jgi:hypothetical protein
MDKFHKPNDSDYQVYFKSVDVLHKDRTEESEPVPQQNCTLVSEDSQSESWETL